MPLVLVCKPLGDKTKAHARRIVRINIGSKRRKEDLEGKNN